MFNPIRDLFNPIDDPIEFNSIDWKGLGVANPYVIIFTGRSGSTLLTRLLNNTKLCGAPDEYFSESYIKHVKSQVSSDNFIDYFNYIVRKHSSNGYFGFEIDAQRFFWLNKLINLEQLLAPHSNVPVVWLTRHDILSQAYSFAVAKATGVWHVYRDGKVSSTDTTLSDASIKDESIWNEMMLILRWEQKIEQLFDLHNYEPLRILYEQVVNDQDIILARIMSHIGLNILDIDKVISQVYQEDTLTTKLRYNDKVGRLTLFYTKYRRLLNELDAKRKFINEADIMASFHQVRSV